MKVAAGFTLIELMVVIVVASILMAIGAPSYRYITNSNRLSAEINALLGDMQFARSEAIKRGTTVTVCPANSDQTACLEGASTWQSGWIVWTAPDEVIRVQQPFANSRDSMTSDQTATVISFNREGFAVPEAGASLPVTFTLQTVPSTAQWVRCLEVGTGGALTTERVGTGNCRLP